MFEPVSVSPAIKKESVLDSCLFIYSVQRIAPLISVFWGEYKKLTLTIVVKESFFYADRLFIKKAYHILVLFLEYLAT